MKNATLLFTNLFISIATMVFATDYKVSFQLDMRNTNIQSSDIIGIRGNAAPLNWGSTAPLTDADGDGIYTGTFTFAEGVAFVEYKFIRGEKWESIPNRSFGINTSDTIRTAWNFDTSVRPYTFNKSGEKYDLPTRMRNEQVVHGFAQIVMHSGKVDTLINWGYRDVANQLPVANNTIFHIGGMCQSLTAFAVLRAVEKGLIDLDKPLNNYLQRWRFDATASNLDGSAFTVRDLLVGKVQFSNTNKPKGYSKGKALPTVLQIMLGQKPANNPKAKNVKNRKEEAMFSIYAGLIAQILLEDIYQKPFASIVQAEILAPLNMTNTLIAAELTPEQMKYASIGYLKNGEAIVGGHKAFPELGFGGCWTTVEDYAKFIQHLMRAARGEDNALLSQKLAKAAIYPSFNYRSLIFPMGDDGNYLGGASTGFRTQTGFDVGDDTLVVTFMNSWENWRVMLDLESAARSLISVKQQTAK